MKKKLLLLIVILNLNGFPQVSELGMDNLQESSSLSELQKFKYEFTSIDLKSTQQKVDIESISLSVKDGTPSRKSPWLAFGLSMLYPGLGQLYNAEYGKALLMGGLGTVGLGLAMLAAMSTDFDSESNPDYIGVILYSGVAVYGAVYIWSMIDAPISATNINERNRKLGIKIFSIEDEKFAIGLRSGKELSSTSLNFSFNF